MNQILFTNSDNNKNNNNKVDIKNVIVIFSVAIIIVAIIIAGIKIYGLYKNKNTKNATPEITITKLDNKKDEIALKVTCKDGIEYIVYTWNNEDENRVNLNNSTTFERIVEIPENVMNNLKIEVKSAKGEIANKTEIFEKNIDSTKPIIDSITIVDKKLSIQASDDNGLEYLSYKWENEEAVQITADQNNNKTITAEIDIQRGTYKLTIKVVDIYGNEEIISKLITGVNEPEISVIKYGDKVNISVTHDMGFKKIEFIINKTVYVYDDRFSGYEKNKTTVEFDFPLDIGENIVQVNAYSLEKLTDEESEEIENYAFKSFTGKCTYEQ